MVISPLVQQRIVSTFPGLSSALGAEATEAHQTDKGSSAQQRDRLKAAKHKYINFQMAGSSVRDGKQRI